MPVTTVTKSEEGQTGEVISAPPEGRASETGQPAVSATSQDQTCRTIGLLKRWPAVLIAIQKSQDAYYSVKKGAGIVNWSLNLAEKALGSVLKFLANKVIGLRPVIQYSDKAVSVGVEAIEKKFPAVRESPEKMYEIVKQQLTNIVRPTVDKIKTISELGRKKLNRAAKRILKKYYAFMIKVDRWMDTLEKKLNGAEHAEVTAGPAAEAESASLSAAEVPSVSQGKSSGRLRQAVQLGAQAATAVAVFQVGAAFWLLGHVPLVGRFFREAPASGSSSSSAEVSSSSSSIELNTPPAAVNQPLL